MSNTNSESMTLTWLRGSYFFLQNSYNFPRFTGKVQWSHFYIHDGHCKGWLLIGLAPVELLTVHFTPETACNNSMDVPNQNQQCHIACFFKCNVKVYMYSCTIMLHFAATLAIQADACMLLDTIVQPWKFNAIANIYMILIMIWYNVSNKILYFSSDFDKTLYELLHMNIRVVAHRQHSKALCSCPQPALGIWCC